MFDAIVIGGSFAGLSGAIYIARARRSVLVIDSGEPRNRFATASHGFFAHDGDTPGDMIEKAVEQLLAYPNVQLARARATSARAIDGGFEVELDDGLVHQSKRLLLATGLCDTLPDVPGLAERWGQTVLHCPYCHGYELGGKPIGVLALTDGAIHQALLVADWGPVTVFTQGLACFDDQTVAELRARGIEIEPVPVTALDGPDDALLVHLEDERTVHLRALFIGAPQRMASPLAEELGCAFDDGPLGPIVQTDVFKETTVKGLYAAGDMARSGHSISHAVGDGVTAGVSLHQSLIDLKP